MLLYMLYVLKHFNIKSHENLVTLTKGLYLLILATSKYHFLPLVLKFKAIFFLFDSCPHQLL